MGPPGPSIKGTGLQNCRTAGFQDQVNLTTDTGDDEAVLHVASRGSSSPTGLAGGQIG